MRSQSRFASRLVFVATMEAELLGNAPAQASFLKQIRAKHVNSKQPESQAVLAVLSAIVDVIKSQKLQPTPVAVFAAVVSSLSTDTAKGDPQARSRHAFRALSRGLATNHRH